MWLIALAGLILAVVVVYKMTSRGDKLPPIRTGWLPWVGCALQLGKEPLTYIHRARRELGGIFTIHAAGKYMTFVSELKHHNYYYTTPHMDFQKAIQPFAKKTANISKESFYTHNSENRDIVKSSFAPANLSKMIEGLSFKLYHQLRDVVCGEVDLMEMVRSVVFPAVTRQFFGDDLLPQGKEAVLEFQNNFFKYDYNFEYGGELPEFLLRDWSEKKHWLLSRFRLAQQSISKVKETPFTKILAKTDKENAAGSGLLMLWAVQANVTPSVFWTLCYILSDPSLHQDVVDEVRRVLPPSGQLGSVPVSYEMTQQLSVVKRCVLETVRLRAIDHTRMVVKTHQLEGYTIPEGHYLSLSPYWEHRDPILFPDPEAYNPDRWRSCDLNKFQFLEGFVGFGAGRYQCPGRWFALTEMCMVVAMVMHMFDLKLVTSVPKVNLKKMVGIQQPLNPCRVMLGIKN